MIFWMTVTNALRFHFLSANYIIIISSIVIFEEIFFSNEIITSN